MSDLLWGVIVGGLIGITIQIIYLIFDFLRCKEKTAEFYEVDVNSLKDFVGKKVFIRTVTYHMVGKVEKLVGNMFEMSNASWVADSGRFMNAIKEGKLDEVEPVGQAWLNTQSIVDMFPWTHKLPTKQK